MDQKAELLAIPQIAKTVTARKLSEYQVEVSDQIESMKTAKQRAFQLYTNLNRGIAFFDPRAILFSIATWRHMLI